MTSKKQTPVKKSVGKLKLKKATIRDLDPKGKSSEVKGGEERFTILTRGRAAMC